MLHIVHHPNYVAPRPASGSFVFDKYQLVMEAIRVHAPQHLVYQPAPMARAWIEAVHDPDDVEEVLTAAVPRQKERRIGFPVSAEIASRVQYTSGGTWLAAQLALEHGYAANSAGGSHHAMADTGAGYCVFNDLAIAANRLLAEGDARKILIVDLDVHQGDGTAILACPMRLAMMPIWQYWMRLYMKFWTVSGRICCSIRPASTPMRTTG